ncbi:restriction endonuclease subunit S [Acholeplasma manati]|uniref:Restriction endonuclease subunit S n=1 Tax=Paracholeplasma manati TaxID=591373 RepID=A0ABT2Y3A5_9MOLU|nr:restriction endonuclease subunit S [Paracholeplasma manati]MCV2231218.1 restriction endonuclease subunit S [Paracholeplasma manati]
MSNTDWYGVVPSSWSISRIKNILIERNESNNPIKTDFILSLTNDRGVIPYSEKGAVGNNSKEDIKGYKLAYPGDLVLNSMNVVIGSVGISNYFGCVSPVYYMLRPRNQNDSIEFYNYLFQTTELQNALKGYGNGILEIRMRIAMSKLNTFLLPKPDCSVQNKIVRKIKESEVKIDQLINNQQQQIEKLKEYKQSLISEVVTKGLDPNVEFKDSGIKWIGRIPTKWRIVPLKHSHLITMGQSPKSESYNTDQMGKPFLGGNSDISEGFSNPKYYTTEITKTCDKYDILMSVRAPVGTVAVSLHDAVLGRGLCSVKSNISNEYSFFYMTFLENKWDEFISGTTFESVNADDIKNISFVLPSLKEIQEMVVFLRDKTMKIEKLIKLKNDKISLLNEYKKSLIYEYVTGKKEVS